MRCFISFPLPETIKNAVYKIQTELGYSPLAEGAGVCSRLKINWTQPDALHVTVEFLGEISDDECEIVKNILAGAAANAKPFIYALGKIDAFPNLQKSKVIVMKVGEDGPDARSGQGNEGLKLHDAILKELVVNNLLFEDKLWQPHITLGRVKSEPPAYVAYYATSAGRQRLKNTEEIKIPAISWRVEKIELIKSELLPNGPKYTILESYQLGKR